MFNSGVRPAINVGISVSRVGGSAQIKSMKKVAGTLKLDQAQFRELQAFAKFGSDLDPVTLGVIEKGMRNVEILKQAQNDPFTVEDQVAITSSVNFPSFIKSRVFLCFKFISSKNFFSNSLTLSTGTAFNKFFDPK